MSPASSLFEIAASTRRMILPERVFGMSGTITIRRGRAMGPISRITDASTRLRMFSLGVEVGDPAFDFVSSGDHCSREPGFQRYIESNPHRRDRKICAALRDRQAI